MEQRDPYVVERLMVGRIDARRRRAEEREERLRDRATREAEAKLYSGAAPDGGDEHEEVR
jgi:hypothetical protein